MHEFFFVRYIVEQ